MSNQYAGFWQRFLMFIVDLIIMIILFTIGSKLMGLEFVTALDLSFSAGIAKWLIFLIPAVYIIGFWVILGGTPGKLIFKTRIVDAKTGGKANLGKLILRYICYSVSKTLLGLGFIWIGLDSRKQSWHDKVAGTVVVKKSKITEPFVEASQKDKSRWKTGKILFVISAIILVALIIIINLDAPLNPNAKVWLAEMGYMDENAEQNGYYDFVAMRIAEELDANQVGFNYIKNKREEIFQNNYDLMDASKGDKIENVEFEFDINTMKDAFNGNDLIKFCTDNSKDLISLYKRYSFMEKRYYKSLDRENFRNTNIPCFGNYDSSSRGLLDINLLNNFSVLAMYVSKDYENSLNQISRNIGFDRRFATKSSDPINIDKLLASSKTPFFKPNDTINLEFEQKQKFIDLSKATGKLYAEQYEAPQSLEETLSSFSYIQKRSLFSYLFNPTGSVITNIANDIYNSYIGKFHYTDGYLNMLKLKVMILDEGIASKDIPAFLEKYASTLYNPFTERAMSWDAERSMLYFDGPDPEDNKIQSELKINLEK